MKTNGLVGQLQIAGTLGLVLFAMVGAEVPGHAQLPTPTQIVTYHLPLEMTADLLEQRYGVPVTYENPVQVSPVELGVRRQPNGIDVPALREHSLALPADLTPEKTPKLDAALLRKIVEAYNSQNPDQPRFQVLESKLGLHILPLQVHDEAGKLVPATSILDARINVPVEKRTPSEHVKALCDALTAATGITTKSASSIDWIFAANGYLFSLRPTHADEKPYMLFEWGASGITAREALIDLLGRSATTMSWRIAPGPVGQRTGLYCWLNLNPLVVGPQRRAMLLDRCTNCRPVPTGSATLGTSGSLAQGAQVAALASVKRIYLTPNPADYYFRRPLLKELESEGFQAVDDPQQADAILIHMHLSPGPERVEGPRGITYTPVELWAIELKARDGKSIWAKDFRKPFGAGAYADLLVQDVASALRQDVDAAAKGGEPKQ